MIVLYGGVKGAGMSLYGIYVAKEVRMTAEEKLKEEALLKEYREAVACGSTNMDFKTWCWCKELNNPVAVTTLNLSRPNS